MEHHMHHHSAPLHWGYSNAPTSQTSVHNTWVPPPSRGLKRSISESDCEDNYSETSSKDTSPKDDADSCQHMSRKKRRGVIEKKRRDRINSSLSELKRLVPSAYEKQGSSKLEKAEILQLTVDHLKTLHSKGADALAYDPQRFAMDYHIIGFRECAAEVARYLLNHEGMDIQDPLRMRLLSHLQCFVAQREISAKSQNVSLNSSWSSAASSSSAVAVAAHHTPYVLPHHQGAYVPPPVPPSTLSASSVPVALASSTAPTMYHQSGGYTTSTHLNQSNAYAYVPNLPPSAASTGSLLSETITSTGSTSDGSLIASSHSVQQQQQQHYAQHEDQNGSTYTDLSSNIHRNSYSNAQYSSSNTTGYNSSGDGNTSPGGYNNNNKPYRPWGTGTEMAY